MLQIEYEDTPFQILEWWADSLFSLLKAWIPLSCYSALEDGTQLVPSDFSGAKYQASLLHVFLIKVGISFQ